MKKLKVRKVAFHELEVARLLAEHAANLDGETVDEMQPVTILSDEDTDDITVEYTAFEDEYVIGVDISEDFKRLNKIQAEMLIFKNKKDAEEFTEKKFNEGKLNPSWLDNLMNDILKAKQGECTDCRFQCYCPEYTK